MRRLRRLGAWLLHAALLGLIVLPALWLLAHLFLPAQATPLMVIRWLDGKGWQQEWVDLDAISPQLARAVIAAEDNRFCQHRGVDWGAIREAQAEVASGERSRPRGASTIPQQTVKNLLLWPEQARVRKALELTYVTWLEALWDKERILETYLNIAEFGPGIYGAEAAARHHFGVTAAELTAGQAALLATALPNPLGRDAGSPSAGHKARARQIEARMRGLRRELLFCLDARFH